MGKKLATEEIYNILKNRIIKIHYEPGTILNEVELSKEFNISRTPIRDIFQKLCNDKLLKVIPRYGAQIAHIDFRYMKSVFEMTREFESLATKLCIDNISQKDISDLKAILDSLNKLSIDNYQEAISLDEQFHTIIIRNTGNICLEEILSGLHIHTERLWHYSEEHINNMTIFTDTLGKIYEAIVKKDKDAADRYAREHIDLFVENVRKEML